MPLTISSGLCGFSNGLGLMLALHCSRHGASIVRIRFGSFSVFAFPEPLCEGLCSLFELREHLPLRLNTLSVKVVSVDSGLVVILSDSALYIVVAYPGFK